MRKEGSHHDEVLYAQHESEHYRCHDRTGEPSCLPYVLHQWHFLRRFHDRFLGSAILAESILFALALVLGLLLAVLSLLVLVSVRISPPRSANRRYILASAA